MKGLEQNMCWQNAAAAKHLQIHFMKRIQKNPPCKVIQLSSKSAAASTDPDTVALA